VRELGEGEVDEQGEDENEVDGVGRIGHPDAGETKDLGEEPGHRGDGQQAGEEQVGVR
jgi:hypothetical protein